MPKDLRSFINELETKYPEEVARVTRPISPRYEITALLTQLEKSKRFPLLYCEKVEGSDAPVVINAQASRKLMALALECKPEELAAKFTERQAKPIAPMEVTDAPVQDVVKTGYTGPAPRELLAAMGMGHGLQIDEEGRPNSDAP